MPEEDVRTADQPRRPTAYRVGMANTAPQASRESGRTWERATTRNAILEAARRVAGRDGVLQTSLNRVAREAGFAPASVYPYFVNRSDLLRAVIAEDLAMLARSMRGTAAFENNDVQTLAPEEPEDSLVGKSTSPIQADFGEENRRAKVLHESVAVEPPGNPIHDFANHQLDNASEDDADEARPGAAELSSEAGNLPAVESDLPRDRAQLPPADTIEAIAQLREAIAKLESRPVDAWLERRLREFERGLAVLEEKLGKSANANSPALAAVEQSLGELRERLDLLDKRQHDTTGEMNRNINQRIDVSERRFRESLSDLHTAVAQSSRRLDAVENAAFAAAPDFFRGADAAPQAPQAADAAAPPAAPEVMAPDEVRQSQQSESYISVARRSAQAASLAEVVGKNEKPHAGWLSKSRTLYFASGCVALVAMLVATGILFRSQTIHHQPVHVAQAAGHVSPVRRTRREIALDSTARNASMTSHLVALANAGDARAALVLALDGLDAHGNGDKSSAVAIQWLTQAAARGEAVAQYRLATLYQDGHGVPPDLVQAFHWYESAAMQGNRKAMHSLAVAYAEGWGTPKNLAEAARWFSRAASLGFVNSEFNLGVLYERGLGVPQSLLDAYKWYAIASAQGDRESAARVEALKSELSGDDLAAAEKGAETFKPDPMVRGTNIAPRFADFANG